MRHHFRALYKPLQPYSSDCAVPEISREDATSQTGGISLYTAATCLPWLCFGSVYLFVRTCAWVHVCFSVRECSLIRMMDAVINLIRSPLRFAVCQSRHHRVTSVQSLPFNEAAALTCSLSTAVAT